MDKESIQRLENLTDKINWDIQNASEENRKIIAKIANLDGLDQFKITHPTSYSFLECTLASAAILGLTMSGYFLLKPLFD